MIRKGTRLTSMLDQEGRVGQEDHLNYSKLDDKLPEEGAIESIWNVDKQSGAIKHAARTHTIVPLYIYYLHVHVVYVLCTHGV